MLSVKSLNRYSRAVAQRSKASSTSITSRVSGKGEVMKAGGRKKAADGKQQTFAGLFCLLLSVLCLLLAACKREERGYRVDPPAAARVNSVTLSELRPGEAQTASGDGVKNEYEQNA